MREILFRGKTNEGEWIFGHYVHQYGANMIYLPEGIDREHGFDYYHVAPETIGQYTGLVDKDGKKIFEGDIVEGHCHSRWNHELRRCLIAYDRDQFEARHYVVCGGEARYYTYRVLFSKDVVVIGNIHDHPELIEGD